jgi:hypothetical protein
MHRVVLSVRKRRRRNLPQVGLTRAPDCPAAANKLQHFQARWDSDFGDNPQDVSTCKSIVLRTPGFTLFDVPMP